MKQIAITMGDAAGVGPEIILKTLKKYPEYRERCVVYGAAEVLAHYNRKLGFDLEIACVSKSAERQAGAVNVVDCFPLQMQEFQVGQLSARCGDAAYHYLKGAVEAAKEGEVAAVVTGPLNKEALHMGGHLYAGHTEILAELTGTRDYAMLLWSPKLKVIHATTHVSLRQACDLVTRERVACVVRLAHETLRRTGIEKPRIAVAGLNPHAGEHGLFGEEEIREIIPAIEQCQKEQICVTGPEPPDTVFLKASEGAFDLVAAMYHDQGHIPLKLMGFQDGVNVTVGLPVIRTSVDHGTAFDIAGKGLADETSMVSALRVAEQLM